MRYLDIPICHRGWYNKWGSDLHIWPAGQTCAKPIGYWFNGRQVMILTGPAIVANGEPRQTTYMEPNADGSMPSGLTGIDRWVAYDQTHSVYNAQKLFDLLETELFRQAIARALQKHPNADPRSFPTFSLDGQLQPAPAPAFSSDLSVDETMAMGMMVFGMVAGLGVAALLHWFGKNLTGSPSTA